MLAPDDKPRLSPKPYLSATPRFAGGGDTPRDFLERCLADLAALEPKIGAFVHLGLDAARAARPVDRALARGKPLSKIDGVPVGIKDIIETSTCRPSRARRCSWAATPGAMPRAWSRCARPAR